jgi:hypothetical protein
MVVDDARSLEDYLERFHLALMQDAAAIERVMCELIEDHAYEIVKSGTVSMSLSLCKVVRYVPPPGMMTLV